MKRFLLIVVTLLVISCSLFVFAAETDSGNISVYFNGQRDDLCQVIKDTINATYGDILIAMYDFTSESGLAEFILDISAERTVKILFDKGGNDDAYNIVGNASNVKIRYVNNLHHKFVVVGEQIVITGSANWSENSLDSGKDANNLVVIKSTKIARAFQEEFYRQFENAKPYQEESILPEAPNAVLF